MKISFIHTGDLHIGRQFHFGRMGDVYGKNKRADLWETFDKILNTAKKNQIELLLIAGDLFDSETVEMAEVNRVADKLKKLEETRVVICAGNHDPYSKGSPYAMIKWPKNVSVFSTGKLESVYFPDINVEIFGMSWVKKAYTALPFSTNIPIDHQHTNILMLHGDVDAAESEYMPIPIDRLIGFDYIALGHIHKTAFFSPTVAYCGSPEGLDFGESGEHGMIAGCIEDHECIAEFVPTTKRQYVDTTLEINSDMTMDDIKEVMLACDAEEKRTTDYYRFRLCGYRDPEVRVEWLREELQREFYYIEIDDTQLEVDLDIDAIYAENRNNIVGRFIETIRMEGDDPIAQKALQYGIESILKEKVVL